jgi:iron(II)-dependent oxidoreductase
MATPVGLRAALAAQLSETRWRTLALAGAAEDAYTRRVHPFYSPMGWHLGHVGMTEAFWILERAGGRPPFRPDLVSLFANVPENPKENRCALPPYADIVGYLEELRARVLDHLRVADFAAADPLLRDAYCFRFALAHEWQHQETMIELLYLMDEVRSLPSLAPAGSGAELPLPAPLRPAAFTRPVCEMIVPDGEFLMGSDEPHGYDNERPAHSVDVPAFAIDETPVTVAQFNLFIADGGYRRRELWDEAGWAWVASSGVTAPEHASRRTVVMSPAAPVCGVNWYEASAYARWRGSRLPTEVEWEKAAAWCPATGETRRYPWGDAAPTRAHADHDAVRGVPAPVGSFPAGRSACGVLDMAGGVWEWTSSRFRPYDGFVAFPYRGYSQPHFGVCRVLKGGSWATRGPLLRSSFRNFYPSDYRQGFLGFRCARSLGRGTAE